jgi:hypothetical protein
LNSGISSDTFYIEPVSDFSGVKNVKLNFLQLKKPYLNGQPQFSGQSLGLVFKSKSHKMPEWQGFCPNDSGSVSISGYSLPGFQYQWKQKTGNQWSDPQFLGNPGNLHSRIWPGTENQLLLLETRNPKTNCTFLDSIMAERYSIPNPEFHFSGQRLTYSGIPANFSGIWRKNGLLVYPDSAGFVGFSDGDSLSLELISPQNCHFYFNQSSYFTRVQKAEKWESIRLIPNPAIEEVEIKITDYQSFEYYIQNQNGQKIMQGTLSKSPLISLKKLPPGIYFLHLNNTDGSQYVKRLVKAKS